MPDVSSATADPEGDGLQNLLEYALGQNPLAADAGQDASGNSPYAVSVGAGSTVSLTYNKLKAATDVTYVVEQSTDLLTWTTASPSNQILSDNGVIQRILATVSYGSNSRFFLRLKIVH
jgi:hypothetical protein